MKPVNQEVQESPQERDGNFERPQFQPPATLTLIILSADCLKNESFTQNKKQLMAASVWKEGSQTVYVLQCNKMLWAGWRQDRTSLDCSVPSSVELMYYICLSCDTCCDKMVRYHTTGSQASGTKT